MKKIIITILTMSVLLLCIGISYSYFTGMIFGSGKKLSVTARNLRILFTDNEELDKDLNKHIENSRFSFSCYSPLI